MNEQIGTLLKTSLGNVIEWYDFTLYGVFAVSLSNAFFPSADPFLSLLATFAVFAVGFLARPIGALIFGYLGDKIGRYYAMNLSIAIMGITTVAMALVPSYAMIGVAAPLIMIGLRIAQGLSASGQFGNLLTATSEFNNRYKGVHLGFAYSVSVIGCLLATLVSLVVMRVTPAEWQPHAWRVPFALSTVLLLVQMYCRSHDVKAPKMLPLSPVKTLFAQHRRALFAATALSTSAGSLYHVVATYFLTYMTTYLGLSDDTALRINAGTLLLILFLTPLAGWCSDCYGRQRILNCSIVVLLFTCFPLLLLFSFPQQTVITLAILLLAIFISLHFGASTPLLTELFPEEIRATGCSLAIGLGATLSGFSPLLANIAIEYFPQYGLLVVFYLLTALASWASFNLPSKTLQQMELQRQLYTTAVRHSRSN